MLYLHMNNSNLENSYISALELASSHYENFPVVSFLIPKYLRKHVAIVYQFARQADDLADEGEFSVEVRLSKLDQYEADFKKCLKNEFAGDFWSAVANTINFFELTPDNFFNLLSAFKQDVTKNRFDSYDEILFYCRHSANPVGRIVLELYGIRDEKLFSYSDSICTALQLTNFYQDVKIDIDKNRIYIPLDELEKFSVTEDQYLNKNFDGNIYSLMKYQIDRAEDLFRQGMDLIPNLSGLLKHEINWTVLGGMKILKSIKLNNYDVFSSRPELSRTDMLKLVLKSFIM